MAPQTAAEPSHGARAETERQALLLAVQALGVNAERVQEAERKQAEAERDRGVAVQLLTTLLGKLEDAEVEDADVWKQDMLVLAADQGEHCGGCGAAEGRRCGQGWGGIGGAGGG